VTRYFAGTHLFTFDKQGRFIVPDELLALAGISKKKEDNVVMVGALTKFSLYQPELWTHPPAELKYPLLAEDMRKLKI
jgi:DNA-binding transcriptional regulator/RsmH inhibitor MraZ